MKLQRTLILLLAIVGLAVLASPAKSPERRHIDPRSEAADPDKAPFSGAVLVGDTLYLSGDIGLDPGNKVPAEATVEAWLLMERFEKRLSAAGMTMDDLVYVTVYFQRRQRLRSLQR